MSENAIMNYVDTLLTGKYGTQINNIWEAEENIKYRNLALEIASKYVFGYVYVIKGTHNGVVSYKIGKADNLEDRLKRFEVKIPFDIELVAAFYVKRPLDFEKVLHAKFSDKRKAGEWFDLDKLDIYTIVSIGLQKENEDFMIHFDLYYEEKMKLYYKDDKEYIEYLETMLIMNNIEFIARGLYGTAGKVQLGTH